MLPVRDAVRTSALSRDWRLRWRSAPAIIFDESSLPRRGQGNASPSSYCHQLASKYMRTCGGVQRGSPDAFRKAVKWFLTERPEMLDQLAAEDILVRVLLQHEGPLETFRLSLPLKDGRSYREVIKAWLKKLYRSDIRELVLERCGVHLPEELFSGRKGFQKLVVLKLKGVAISTDDLVSLMSCCPSLSRMILDIRNVEPLPGRPSTALVVSAPHLRHLEMRLSGSVWCIRLVTPDLVSAWISLRMFNGILIHTPLRDGGCNLNHLLAESPQLQKLTITSLSLQFLCAGKMPFNLQQQLGHLEWLELNMSFASAFHARGALCLFKSSPSLKCLRIRSWLCSLYPSTTVSNPDRQATISIWENAAGHCSFPRLEHLVIDGLNNIDPQLAFMRFVLREAPVLAEVEMDVTRYVSSGLEELLVQLRGMTRATVYAAAGSGAGRVIVPETELAM